MPARTPTPSYRPGEVAELLGVSVDTVRRLADDGTLRTTRTKSGQRLIDGAALATYLADHGATAMRDRDAAPIVAQSARNRLSGIVTRVVKDKVAAQVEMQVGPHRIVSLMTREAVDDLGLAPGMIAIASVKSTNVVIEVPQQ
jgi:molybdopterin-binding protein